MALRKEEVYEGSAGIDSGQWAERLFEQMQKTMHLLLQKYQIEESDLRGALEVIGQLWDLVEETQTSCETAKEQFRELEEKWKEEKGMRRQAEKRKADIENKLDDERYQWQSERQEMQREKVTLETKNKHLAERNNDLLNDMKKQKDQFENNQRMRDELMEQYKKQYEIAKTSTLKRKKKNQTPSTVPFQDFSPSPSKRSLPSVSPAHSSHDSGLSGSSRYQSRSPSYNVDEVPGAGPSNRQKRQLPSMNMVSLKTEMQHPLGNSEEDIENEIEESGEMYEPNEFQHGPTTEDYNESLQQELLNVSPDILAPAAAELEVLRREQEETKRENERLQHRFEKLRQKNEELERDNAEISTDVTFYKEALLELQEQLLAIRAERDEILESYLDQPFDVYCVTKKELHEVLKKLHDTQLEVHKQNEEKQSLKMELEKKNKKSGWKRFADRFKSLFQREETQTAPVAEDVEETITSFVLPLESPFSAKTPKEILEHDNFYSSKGWLVPQKGLPTPELLPSLYCQITLKEYHVTEKINCMALGRVNHSLLHSPRKGKLRLIPLAARTSKGKLSAEVWIASSEGPASFIEIIDVLGKRVLDRFLVKGTQVVGMTAVPGKLSSSSASGQDSPLLSPHKKDRNDLFHNCNPNWYANSPQPPHRLESAESSSSKEVSKEERNTEESTDNGGPAPLLLADVITLSSSSSHQDGPPICFDSSENCSDEETDGGVTWKNSTPYKDDESSVASYCSVNEEKVETYMWVLSDDITLKIYTVHEQYNNRPIRSINLPANPSCIKHFNDKVCIGLNNSKLLVYHFETIMSESSWDMENPSLLDLPVINPEKPQPVYSVALVGTTLWVATGAFISLLDTETLERQGMRFLDSIQNTPHLLLPVNDVVLATTLKGHHLYVLDSERAEVIRKVDISPTSILLDNLMSFSALDITLLTNDLNNLYIGTSVGKVFTMPLCYFEKENVHDSDATTYPPSSHSLFEMSAVALHCHRESIVQGLLHIQLPEAALSGPISTSTLNLTQMSSGLSNASSLTNLAVDSPPLPRSNRASFPVYHSLLVTGGKGHKNYLEDNDLYQESTAVRERNDAFQLIVWGFDNSSSNSPS